MAAAAKAVQDEKKVGSLFVTGLVTGLWFLLHPAARLAPEPQRVPVP